jgi:enamine deaminase RidA (YjgF/YER057c/UK114 family)
MPDANNSVKLRPGARLRELGLQLPKPPTPLGAYVETVQTGSLLFLSGTLPVLNGKLAIEGRVGAGLTIDEGREAARIAALNALALAQQHLGDLDKAKRLVKLAVLVVAADGFKDHASVADGASLLFAQIFGTEAGHVRAVYGIHGLPLGAPVMLDTVFELHQTNQ